MTIYSKNLIRINSWYFIIVCKQIQIVFFQFFSYICEDFLVKCIYVAVFNYTNNSIKFNSFFNDDKHLDFN